MLAERWNWFMTVNAQGKWISTAGHADVTMRPDLIEATLRLEPTVDPYHVVKIMESDKGETYAEITSPGEGRSPPFYLKGLLNTCEMVAGKQVTSIILTDGFTVLGLAQGQWSGDANMV